VDEVQAEREAELSQLEDTLLHQMQLVGLPTPEREYRFAPPRRYRADFAYPDKMLLIEVEGGVWVRGAHTRGGHYNSDCEKYNLAAMNGWKVLRFTSNMINDGTAIDTIEKVLNE
jgi:very-short-patch-repair endonuclease